ncbi:MAG: hypothetical protein L0H26_09830, partial [Microlunatus sp.]|nr:hypothetical protein [Microlunatus sp.]
YLQARAELIDHYPTMDSDQATLTAEPSRWATAVHGDPGLWRDLAVWRAANDIPDADLTPAGAPLAASRERNHQHHLEECVDRLAGPRVALPASTLELLDQREPGLAGDPFWPVLAQRLSVAAHRSHDVHQLLVTALEQGRLPDERPAAALWFRLAGQLRLVSAEVDADIRLRPDWTDHLVRLLPDRVGLRVLTSPDWPELVAAVADSATHTGLPAPDLLDQAVALVDLGDPAAGGLPPDAVPAILSIRLYELAAPTPASDEPEPQRGRVLHGGLRLRTAPRAAPACRPRRCWPGGRPP